VTFGATTATAEERLENRVQILVGHTRTAIEHTDTGSLIGVAGVHFHDDLAAVASVLHRIAKHVFECAMQ